MKTGSRLHVVRYDWP